MKLFNLSFFLLLIDIIPIDVPIARPDEEKPTFTISSTIPAIHTFQSDTKISLNITPSQRMTIKEVFKVGHNSNDFYYIVNPNEYKIVQEEYTSTYTLPTRMYFDDNGCYIYIQFVNQSGKIIDSHGWNIKPVSESVKINPLDYIRSPYTAYNTKTLLANHVAIPINESFSFPEYIDYFNIDVYHKLDLDSISFIYNSTNTFKYRECSLIYYDFDGVFPFISHDREHRISIPLSIKINNKKVTFSYRDIMYVHPKTLQMSLTKKEEFVRTRYFYLPVNQKDKLVDETMAIDIYEAGESKNDIHWPLTYLAYQDVIGDCVNSEYCVVEEES